jgi:hypothetical protein
MKMHADFERAPGPGRKRNFLSGQNPAAWADREATWRERCLPDFVIIGAQKSGTSSLYAYLRQHPDVLSAIRKEVHYFDGDINPEEDNYRKGERWYRAHFPKTNRKNENQRVFEASPLYIFYPPVPQRLAGLIPKVKLIAVLRNPTERAISHYFHVKRRGYEPLPIMEALLAEEERLKPILEREDYKNSIYIRHSYKSRGRYSEQISRYFEFFPPDQMLIISSDELFSETSNTLRKVFNFVGVDPNCPIPDLRPRGKATNRTDVDEEVYVYLNESFHPHNQNLYQIIGRDFGW